MNVLRIVYEWPPPLTGLAPGPFELTRAQSMQGHTMRVICGGWPRHLAMPVPGVRVRRLPSALQRLGPFPSTAPAALAWTLFWHRWADVIHGHGHLPVWYHLWRRAIGDRKPYVLHLHCTAAIRIAGQGKWREWVDPWAKRFRWPLHKLSDQVGCVVADAVICVSESVRDEAVRYYGAAPEKLYVVANGVNTELFTAEGESARERHKLSTDDKVMLYVGGLRPIKRLHLLIEALGALPAEWKLLLVGQGSLETELRSQAQRLGLTGRVRFLGHVPYSELPAVYRGADVFVLSSYSEGFPKVILEALVCGVPVVVTPSFRGDEHIESHLTYLQGDTPDEVAKAVQLAISGPPVDVAYVRDVYDWRVRAEAVRQVYQNVMDRQARGLDT